MVRDERRDSADVLLVESEDVRCGGPFGRRQGLFDPELLPGKGLHGAAVGWGVDGEDLLRPAFDLYLGAEERVALDGSVDGASERLVVGAAREVG